MNGRAAVLALGALVVGVVVLGRPDKARSEVTTPRDPSAVVATLPLGPGDARRRAAADLRRALARDPKDLRAALSLARLDIELARENGDPRHLGHAEATLAPWWSNDDAPAEVLVLRATIEQSLHDFDAALTTLDRAIARSPGGVQAWLTRATVLGVLARTDEARAACAKVAALGATFAASVCTAQIDGISGRAREAHDTLAAVTQSAGPEERTWATSVLGELAALAGDRAAAAEHFRAALARDPRDAYTKAAYADLLLDEGRNADVVELLARETSNDALLLRLAIAERRAGARAEASAHTQALAARFDASRARSDVVHRREEARFWLELGDDPRRALALAKANFEVQREPWDVRVLLEAALAAGASDEARPALAHLARTGLADPVVTALARRLA